MSWIELTWFFGWIAVIPLGIFFSLIMAGDFTMTPLMAPLMAFIMGWLVVAGVLCELTPKNRTFVREYIPNIIHERVSENSYDLIAEDGRVFQLVLFKDVDKWRATKKLKIHVYHLQQDFGSDGDYEKVILE